MKKEDRQTIILQKTIPMEDFMKIFRFKKMITAQEFAEHAMITISVKNNVSVLSLEEILGYMNIKKLPAQFLTMDEVAKMCDAPLGRIKYLTENGIIPYYQARKNKGSKYLYVQAEVLKAIRSMSSRDLEVVRIFDYEQTVYRLKKLNQGLKALVDYLEVNSSILTKNELIIFRSLWLESKTIPAVARQVKLTETHVHNLLKQAEAKIFSNMNKISKVYRDKLEYMKSNSMLLGIIKQQQDELNRRQQILDAEKSLARRQVEILTLDILKVSEISIRTRKTIAGCGIPNLASLVRNERSTISKLLGSKRKSMFDLDVFLKKNNLRWEMTI